MYMLKVRSKLHAPHHYMYCFFRNSSRSSSSDTTFSLPEDSGRFIVVPLIPCNSAEAIRTQNHRWYVVDIHVVLHLSLARRMQIAATAKALASDDKKITLGDAAANAVVRATVHFESRCRIRKLQRRAQDAIHRCGCRIKGIISVRVKNRSTHGYQRIQCIFQQAWQARCEL